jgi:hypothetical protein
MHNRFITAVFLHAGFIHIILNMIAQLTLSAQVSIRYHVIHGNAHNVVRLKGRWAVADS